MQLASPVQITLRSPSLPGGQRVVTVSELDYTINDNVKRRICTARIPMFPRAMILWQGDAYTEAGDYTQAQVEARITELLGSDPAAVLTSMLPKFAQPKADA